MGFRRYINMQDIELATSWKFTDLEKTSHLTFCYWRRNISPNDQSLKGPQNVDALHKTWSFPEWIFQKIADLMITFTEEILNGKLHFLSCDDVWFSSDYFVCFSLVLSIGEWVSCRFGFGSVQLNSPQYRPEQIAQF